MKYNFNQIKIEMTEGNSGVTPNASLLFTAKFFEKSGLSKKDPEIGYSASGKFFSNLREEVRCQMIFPVIWNWILSRPASI